MATTIESRGTGSRGRLHLGWTRGGWIAFGAVVAILALYLLSVLGLVLAVTRPVADEATLRAMVECGRFAQVELDRRRAERGVIEDAERQVLADKTEKVKGETTGWWGRAGEPPDEPGAKVRNVGPSA